MERVILFGAGINGREALKVLGPEKVLCFCDNDESKVSTVIDGKTVISFEEMKKLYRKGYKILVTPFNKYEIIAGLEAENILNYEEYISFRDRYVKEREWVYGKEAMRNNAELDRFVERASKIDFLDGDKEFRLLAEEVLQRYRGSRKLIAYNKYGESGFYGNLETLLKFSGIEEDEMDPAFFPVCCHQNEITENICIKYPYNIATIVPGSGVKDLIHERRPLVPAFPIGPYSLYTKGIYSTQELLSLKKKYGRVATVYLGQHNNEGDKNAIAPKKLLDQVFDTYKKDYDTLFLSVYWVDVGNEFYQYAKNKGFHLVSAGFRFDCKFNQRLKTIFDLSDLIVMNTYSTPLTWALALNKPVEFTDHRIWRHEVEYYSDAIKRHIYNMEYFEQQRFFDRIFNNSTKEYLNHMDELEPYLGLKQLKTPEEIRAIFEISNMIWEEADGDLVWYYEGVRKALKKLEENNDLMRLKLLRDALGKENNSSEYIRIEKKCQA